MTHPVYETINKTIKEFLENLRITIVKTFLKKSLCNLKMSTRNTTTVEISDSKCKKEAKTTEIGKTKISLQDSVVDARVPHNTLSISLNVSS